MLHKQLRNMLTLYNGSELPRLYTLNTIKVRFELSLRSMTPQPLPFDPAVEYFVQWQSFVY